MPTTPHVGDSVYTPERTVDSNRRGFAEQRTRLSPVSNRVDRLDGSAGRVPPPLTMTWVEDISTGYRNQEFITQSLPCVCRRMSEVQFIRRKPICQKT